MMATNFFLDHKDELDSALFRLSLRVSRRVLQDLLDRCSSEVSSPCDTMVESEARIVPGKRNLWGREVSLIDVELCEISFILTKVPSGSTVSNPEEFFGFGVTRVERAGWIVRRGVLGRW